MKIKLWRSKKKIPKKIKGFYQTKLKFLVLSILRIQLKKTTKFFYLQILLINLKSLGEHNIKLIKICHFLTKMIQGSNI